ncbi:MAG: PhoH family protein [Verrucomicrobiota bacterium]
MLVSEVIHFDSARTLSNLLGSDNRALGSVNEAFSVETTTRDGWVKINGQAEAVEAASTLFRFLEGALRKGISIRKHELHYAISAVKEGNLDELEGLWATGISLSNRKPMVLAKTFTQKQYLAAIKEVDLVFGLGPAGTGKTFLAMAAALKALKKSDVSKVILTRPAVEAGEALGFLPGDLQEKLYPYLRPLYDALHDLMDREEVQKFSDKGLIEVAPLAYMRGRTLSKAFVILDEAQNATTEQMFMFLTRMGEGSKCVITGDVSQIDLPRNRKSGLIEALDALQNTKGIRFVTFKDSEIVRHELVSRIVQAYQKHRTKPE